MKSYLCFKIKLVLIVLVCAIISGHHATDLLDLYEGAVCQKGEKNSLDHVCKRTENCPSFAENIKLQRFPPICSFIGSNPVVCCSPSPSNNNNNNMANSRPAPMRIVKPNVTSHSSAVEMCRQYSEMVPDTRITGGNLAEPKEFPHMALLGYGGNGSEEKTWSCGGSLISNRWIMSAAHCAGNSGKLVSWARLGDLNIHLTTDDASPREYEIVEHILHPSYNQSFVYHDIALFRLETDVEFSEYIRPICLNTNHSLSFQKASATGWGRISTTGPSSPDLLKVYINEISIEKCKNSYPPNVSRRVTLGILNDSMICAGDFQDGNDTCTGDSGGPLQIRNANNSFMYTQIGITSFGKHCGSKETPGIYTKVSYYIKWIEQIVWPKS